MTHGGHRPVKFLLVDDREENLTALEALLARDGLELHTARSGDEALELVLRHEYALAILDVQMPEMDGFTLAELMRGSERSRDVPIIFVTADLRERRRVFQGYDAGAVDFLFKPIEPQILKHKAETFYALYKQRQQIADTLRLNETFMAAVGHDLRNPLNVMMMAAQGIELSTAEPSTQKLAKKINDNGRRMARMIEDLFDLARGRVGEEIPLVRRRFDLGTVLSRVVAGHATLHPGRSIEMTHTHRVSGEWDEGRIEQMIDNLVGNALRHGSPDEPVRVEVRAEPHHIRLSVHNGGKISEEVMPHLFDPFQKSKGTATSSKGLGLGLYIVERIVSSHGGAIAVRSSEDEGTTFEVRLPLETAA